MALNPPALLEAILFASGEALDKKRLASMLGITNDILEKAVEVLKQNLEGRGITLIESATELELRTAPEASDIVAKLKEAERARDLGKAGLETLAVILYRGGATRGEIDWVRGVNSSQTLRSLLLRGLIEKTEDSTDKRRPRYQATVDALAHLGVSSAKELPDYQELTQALSQKEAVPAEETSV